MNWHYEKVKNSACPCCETGRIIRCWSPHMVGYSDVCDTCDFEGLRALGFASQRHLRKAIKQCCSDIRYNWFLEGTIPDNDVHDAFIHTERMFGSAFFSQCWQMVTDRNKPVRWLSRSRQYKFERLRDLRMLSTIDYKAPSELPPTWNNDTFNSQF